MLEVLRRVIQEVNGARNLDAALSTMVRRIRKAMQTDVCSFYLYPESVKPAPTLSLSPPASTF
jgi:phosphotransferase system enzyme I (PtsP)